MKGITLIRDWVAVVVLVGFALSVTSALLIAVSGLLWGLWSDYGWIGLTLSLLIMAFGMWRAERDVLNEPRGLSAGEGVDTSSRQP